LAVSARKQCGWNFLTFFNHRMNLKITHYY
jgi:hypothetical protein